MECKEFIFAQSDILFRAYLIKIRNKTLLSNRQWSTYCSYVDPIGTHRDLNGTKPILSGRNIDDRPTHLSDCDPL